MHNAADIYILKNFVLEISTVVKEEYSLKLNRRRRLGIGKLFLQR